MTDLTTDPTDPTDPGPVPTDPGPQEWTATLTGTTEDPDILADVLAAAVAALPAGAAVDSASLTVAGGDPVDLLPDDPYTDLSTATADLVAAIAGLPAANDDGTVTLSADEATALTDAAEAVEAAAEAVERLDPTQGAPTVDGTTADGGTADATTAGTADAASPSADADDLAAKSIGADGTQVAL